MLKTDGSRRPALDEAGAIGIGVKALRFIAADDVQLHRFLGMTGLDVGQLRAAAADPAFFAGLLDFVLDHEPTLLAFAAGAGIAPESVRAARERLGGSFEAVPR